MPHPAQRDNVRELLGAGPPPRAQNGSPSRALAQQRQQDYAAELRQQIAAKEAARQRERSNSLRQSTALLELRQTASSAVLPGGNPGARAPAERSVARQHSDEWNAGWQAHQQQQQQQVEQGAQWPHPAPTGWPAPEQQHAHAPKDAGAGGWESAPAAYSQQQQQQGGPQLYRPGGPLPSGGASTAREHMLHAPYGTDHMQPHNSSTQQQPWQPVLAHAPFGNDLQQTSPTLPRSTAGGLPFWAGGGQPAALPAAGAPRASLGFAGRLAGMGEGQTAAEGREAVDRKRAAYKADLESQMRDKEARRRQEKAWDRASEVQKAQEAEQLLRRAAAGNYGGGSGPLRDADGRPITDLNKMRQHQAQAAQGQQLEGGHSGSRSGSGEIPAHWGPPHTQGPPPAADHSGWRDGSAAAVGPANSHLQRQSSSHASWQGQPGHGHYQQQQQSDVPPGPPRQPSGKWQQAPAPDGEQASWPPAPPQQHPPGNLQSAGPSWPGPAGLSGPTTQPRNGTLTVPAPGGGSDTMTVHLRSDRPYQTAGESERRARTQAEFQDALRAQVEEKARLKAEETRRRVEEEAAEEARLAREQDRMRQQFDSDQAKTRAKQASREASNAETLDSGGITIKFKQPPGGKGRGQQEAQQAQQVQQANRAGSSGGGDMVEPDDKVPGVDIRVKGPPPRRPASSAGEPQQGSGQKQGQQRQDDQHQDQQQEQQQRPAGLQSQGSGARQQQQPGMDALPAAAERGDVSQLRRSSDAQAGGGGAPGASSVGTGVWQGPPGSQLPWMLGPGMQMVPGMMPGMQMQLPGGGMPWQQAWGPPMGPPMYGWGGPMPMPMAMPMPQQQQQQQHYMPPLQLQPLPSLAALGLPPHQAQAPWGPPPPQYGRGSIMQPPWATQQELPPMPSTAGPPLGPGPPWLAPQQQQQQQQLGLFGPPPLLAQLSPWAQHPPGPGLFGGAQPQQAAVGRLPLAGGMPVYETRGVLNIRDTITHSRPPSGRLHARGGSSLQFEAHSPLIQLASQMQTSVAEPLGPPQRSTLTYPPQPPLLRSGFGEAPGSSRRGSMGGSGGQQGVAATEDPGAPAAGLAGPWQMLELPFSRQSSHSAPVHLPPLPRQSQQQQQQQSRGGTGGGTARKRSSWAGLMGAAGSVDVPAGNWPS